jgi:hypothetical protein
MALRGWTGQPKTGHATVGQPRTGQPRTVQPRTVQPRTVQPKTGRRRIRPPRQLCHSSLFHVKPCRRTVTVR